MPESTKPVLTVDLLDDLDGALDRIEAVADLLALVRTAGDLDFLRPQTISRAAFLIEGEACRIRQLLSEHAGEGGTLSNPDP